jgi:hypothetical protein
LEARRHVSLFAKAYFASGKNPEDICRAAHGAAASELHIYFCRHFRRVPSKGREMRKIAPFIGLRSQRIFKKTQWIDRMFAAQVHDHQARSPAVKRSSQYGLSNEFLS